MSGIWFSKIKTMLGSRFVDKIVTIFPQTKNYELNEKFIKAQFDIGANMFEVYLQSDVPDEIIILHGDIYPKEELAFEYGSFTNHNYLTEREELVEVDEMSDVEFKKYAIIFSESIEILFNSVMKEFKRTSPEYLEVYLKSEEEEEKEISDSNYFN